MKLFVVLSVVALMLALGVSAESQRVKPPPLENIDVDNTLKNGKLVRRYIDCILGKGRCDSNGRDLKEMLPRVLKQDCRGCSSKQRNNVNRIVAFMKRNHANDWASITLKYSA